MMWNVLEVLNTKAPTTLLRSVSLQTEDSTPDAALLLERAPSDDRGWNKNSAAADAVPLSAGLLERKTSSIRSPPVMNPHTKMSSGVSGLSNNLRRRDSTWGVIDVDAALARKAGSLRGGLVEKQQEQEQQRERRQHQHEGRENSGGSGEEEQRSGGEKVGRKRSRCERAPPSQHCHVCTRARGTVPAMICAATKIGKCRKVFCIRCFQNFGWDWDAAREMKGNWLCLHCTGECPKMAQCHVYGKVNEKRRLKTKGSSAVKVDGVNEQEKNQKKDSILT